MRKKWWISIFSVILVISIACAQTQEERLAAALKKYPQADTNKDGILTRQEARALQSKMRAAKTQRSTRLAPDLANVHYGKDERNVFDIWFADASQPTPLAIFIHGGGFSSGSKEKLKAQDLSRLLKAGISVASINYRYKATAPLPAAHHDAKQALQFIRSKADELHVDPNRIAAFGSSAGAQICMWLAFSDDMTDPTSDNPIERESTRLSCVATSGGQTQIDTIFWRAHAEKHLSGPYGTEFRKTQLGHAWEQEHSVNWGATTLAEGDANASKASAMSLISDDDPSIYMAYHMSPDAPPPSDLQKVRGWLVHHVDFGIMLKERMDALNVPADLNYPGSGATYPSAVDFLITQLLPKTTALTSDEPLQAIK
ncbi:alpha/beta hydrolase [Opitutales bacterium]|nr:alpha/beta hydrolase [Opitutales bacterium]